jgi:hypothetical protein
MRLLLDKLRVLDRAKAKTNRPGRNPEKKGGISLKQ